MDKSSRKQIAVLQALDKIADRLITIERERDSLREELNSVCDEHQDFQELLIKQTDTRINAFKGEQKAFRKSLKEKDDEVENLRKKVGEVDKHRAVVANVTNDNLKKALDESLKIQRQMRQDMEMNSVRQARLEEELIQSQQRQNSMFRKVEAMANKYQRLSRKIEHVEQISMDAQAALQAKAMVLLTDKNRVEAIEKDIEYEKEHRGFPKIANLTLNEDQDNAIIGTIKRYATTASMIALIMFAIGFGVYRTSYYQQSPKSAQEIVVKNLEKPDSFTEIDQANSKVAKEKAKASQAETRTDTNDQAANTVNGEPNTTNSVEAVIGEEVRISKNNAALAQNVQGPDETLPEVFKDLEMEAFEGKGEAQHDLAALYSSGTNNVKQDYLKAAYWFLQAAENGVSNARYNLGVLYHQGMGVEQDINQAIYWYSRAAELGHPEAQYNLGIANIEGIGTNYNPKLAVAYFRQAAQGGVAEAAYNLGLILENGLLGDENLEEAIYWYAKAKSMNNEAAANALSSLMEAVKLDRSDLKEILAVYDSAYFQGGYNALDTASGSSSSKGYNPAEDIIAKVEPLSDWQTLVASVQGQLRVLELYVGPEDGIYGPKTRDAIKEYQKQYELPVTGEPSRELLAHMYDRTQPLAQGSSL